MSAQGTTSSLRAASRRFPARLGTAARPCPGRARAEGAGPACGFPRTGLAIGDGAGVGGKKRGITLFRVVTPPLGSQSGSRSSAPRRTAHVQRERWGSESRTIENKKESQPLRIRIPRALQENQPVSQHPARRNGGRTENKDVCVLPVESSPLP